MLSGYLPYPYNSGTVDKYYYLLQELDTVTGLMNVYGALIEAYTYDAYGNVRLWGYPPMDFNRDGDVDGELGTNSDFDELVEHFLSTPPGHSMADPNMDCIVDSEDIGYFSYYVTSGPEVPLRVSAVGNPYFFTGRNLHFVERLDGNPGSTPTFNRTVQYNRARQYSPMHGRWLQRDPLIYVDGMNLYEYVASRPSTRSDPTGLYGEDTHNHRTRIWSVSIGMKFAAAKLVGEADYGTDSGSTGPYPWQTQSRHLNRSRYDFGDTRLHWFAIELGEAISACTFGNDRPKTAARALGRGLHSLQDWWAHGDYSAGPLPTFMWHGPLYDAWNLDAVASRGSTKVPINGRAPKMWVATSNMTAMEVPWPSWSPGGLRAQGTRVSTEINVARFLDQIRSNGGCKCRNYFLWDP